MEDGATDVTEYVVGEVRVEKLGNALLGVEVAVQFEEMILHRVAADLQLRTQSESGTQVLGSLDRLPDPVEVPIKIVRPLIEVAGGQHAASARQCHDGQRKQGLELVYCL